MRYKSHNYKVKRLNYEIESRNEEIQKVDIMRYLSTTVLVALWYVNCGHSFLAVSKRQYSKG